MATQNVTITLYVNSAAKNEYKGMDYIYHSMDGHIIQPNGFVNIGANCWFNSLLQALLSCPSFVKSIKDNSDELSTKPFGKALVDLLAATPTQRSTFPPRLLFTFQDAARKYGKTIQVFSQEGCQNGFTVMMELLDCRSMDDAFVNKYHCNTDCPGCGRRVRNMSFEYSIQICSGWDEPILDGQPRVFNEYLCKRVSLIDSYKCEGCEVISKSVPRIETLATIRDVIMVFVVDRSTKEYPKMLEFNAKEGNILKYILVAGIQHIGGFDRRTFTSSGHYICYALRGDKYYLFNDSTVSPATGIPTNLAHVLVYHLDSIEKPTITP